MISVPLLQAIKAKKAEATAARKTKFANKSFEVRHSTSLRPRFACVRAAAKLACVRGAVAQTETDF
jgi:hypothetical protein